MSDRAVDLRRVAALWMPLAASWLLMAAEQPFLTATIARGAEQKIQLAAWGSVVFPISLVVEAPIIMLLTASTALCEDWSSYRRLRAFMLVAGAVLSALHVAIAFTPLFDLVCSRVFDTPPEVVEPARLGLRIMTPWTWAIAYRRFQQGILIRAEEGRAVTAGTLVRLVTVASCLIGLSHGTRWPGVAVGATAIAAGVTVEAAFAGWRVRGALDRLRRAPAGRRVLTLRRLLGFYAPLALTPLVMLLVQPLGSAAMGRMPHEIDSLAAWAPVYGLVFVFRSVGMGYSEVVVALLPRPGAEAALRRFGVRLAAVTAAALGLVGLTPLGEMWFRHVQSLAPELVPFASLAVLLAAPMPAYQALQSWYQGSLVVTGRTRGVTEAVLAYGAVAASACWLGIRVAPGRDLPGLYWAIGSFVAAGIVQTVLLRARSREALSFRHTAA